MSAARKSPAKAKIEQKFYHQQQQHHSWDESINVPCPASATTAMATSSSTSSAAAIKTPTRAASSPLPFKCPKSARNFHIQATSSSSSSSKNPYEPTSASSTPPPPRSPSARSNYSVHSTYSDSAAANPQAQVSGYVALHRGGVLYNDNNSPRSPKITTTNYSNDSCDDVSSSASYYQTPNSGSHGSPMSKGMSSSIEDPFDSPVPCGYLGSAHCSSVSPRRSPNSPRKFVFDAISPHTDHAGNKKFEYYEPISPENANASAYFDTTQAAAMLQQQQACPKSPKIYEPRRQNSKKLMRGAAYGIGGSGGMDGSGNGSNDWELPILTHIERERNLNAPSPSNYYVKRDSCVTDTTQLSMESNDTTNSTMNTTTTSFSYSDHSHSKPTHQVDEHTNANNVHQQKNAVQLAHSAKRRHAINITSNPGYQVLHSSHSTLDRTCSDSAVSLRYRKSTSDLTSDVDAEKQAKQQELIAAAAAAASNSNYKPRRRGSSKGGLAYLASRRSSRESMKSACSNTSIFSNDDVGPLAFQSSNRGRQRRTSNFLELPVPDHIRPRVCSLPDRPYNPRVSDDLYRLRHFSISKGNVVNCGDSIISRRSRSNTSVNSTNSRASERSPFEGSCCGGGYANVDSLPVSPDDDDDDDETDNLEPPPPQRYRVVMLGDAGVGKTALVNQFMTSEYMHTYDASLDDEFGEKTVSVLLDDEESDMVFIDHPSVEMSVENSLSTYEPHGCVVVFSVVDKSSFRVAEEIINYLWQENYMKDKAVILVGNKADLARARVITSQDGKSLAASRDAKFIETSSGIQHNVDELLVGILKQMRLKGTRESKKSTSSKMKTSRTHISLHMAKEFLQKICLSDISKSKSCENLHVL